MKNLFLKPCLDSKPTSAFHADYPGVCITDKILNISTIDKIHLKCDVIDGSVVTGIREPILCSFFIRPAGFRTYCQLEKNH